jgi:hypothetical protein
VRSQAQGGFENGGASLLTLLHLLGAFANGLLGDTHAMALRLQIKRTIVLFSPSFSGSAKSFPTSSSPFF